MYKSFFKRVLDFSISLVALVCLSPVLLIVTIWLHFANKGAGAFFFQERPGLHGKIFKVIKFKTMTDERDAEGNLLPDADRLTKVGRFVRSTSIDELPQLVNVLKGDMALIGPRPLLVQYLPLRHFRLGAVSWAQCHLMGREVQARRVVCGPCVVADRSEGHRHYRHESAAAGRHQRGGTSYHRTVQRAQLNPYLRAPNNVLAVGNGGFLILKNANKKSEKVLCESII